ncbi:MAG: MEDS domain-containing protein [Candidatus Omnitrophica bacterium]|nr:MEDS domain-containing protein [Candidatus Omnitrophota bacterium]
MRKTGIEIIGDARWGTHFCQFYQTRTDLADILVPYFKAGLEQNEFCMWITSPDLTCGEAEAALRKAVPNLSDYLEKGQIEILAHTDWYLKGGSFDKQRVLDGWISKLELAQAMGFDGLRLSGNTVWLEKADWEKFAEYERAVDEVIGRYQIIALCTYPLASCSAVEILEMMRNHQFALIKGDQGWQMVENSDLKRARERALQSEQALRESRHRLSVIVDSIADGLYAIDRQWRFIHINKAALSHFGRADEQFIGRNLFEVFPAARGSVFESAYRRAFETGEPAFFETASTVVERTVEVHAYPGPDSLTVIFRDITERKQREQELQKLNRTLQALSNSSQAMMRARDEKEFLDEVCQIVVKDCGYAMVWIGLAEEDEYRTVRPVAHAGFEEGYLESLRISWADTDRGRGPTGTSVRTGKPAVCADILHNPQFIPWREQALRRGYASSIALPLISGERTFGAITIYSKEQDAFSENEVKLLSQLADDLSFGIMSIRWRMGHEKARAEAVTEKNRLEAVMETLPVGVSIIDAHGGNIRSNPMFERIWGGRGPKARTVRDYSQYKAWWLNTGKPVQPEEWAAAKAVHRGETVVGQLMQIEKFNGSRAFVLNSASPIFDAEGHISGSAVAILDITDRVQGEEALRQSEERYRRLFEDDLTGDFIAGKNGEIHACNPAFLRLYGFSNLQEALKGSLADFNPQEWPEILTRLKEQGRIERHQARHHCPDGREIYVVENVVGIFDASGELVEIKGYIFDNTEQHKAQEALYRSNARLNLLAETAGELLGSDSPQEVVESLCRKVMAFLDCQAFFNFLVDEEAGKLHLNACAGVPPEVARKIEWLDYGVAVCGCVARDGRRIVAEDNFHTPDPRTDLVKSYGIQAYACHPLLSQGKVLGTLSFGTRTRVRFTEDVFHNWP